MPICCDFSLSERVHTDSIREKNRVAEKAVLFFCKPYCQKQPSDSLFSVCTRDFPQPVPSGLPASAPIRSRQTSPLHIKYSVRFKRRSHCPTTAPCVSAPCPYRRSEPFLTHAPPPDAARISRPSVASRAKKCRFHQKIRKTVLKVLKIKPTFQNICPPVNFWLFHQNFGCAHID